MTKSRLTLTLEPEEEEAVRAAAQAEGLDLSAFLRVAALSEVARVHRIAARFAELDGLSRAAEAEPADDTGVMPPSAADREAMKTYLDAIDAAFARRGGAAA
ncbi:hypothetical protein [Actinacidiphila yeochonensis]|uniref:hypothetical protein n=1 Tax=Actinacidiphila yeochonensis TaxID=89050 RepID=UPI000564E157|nr:hypothetical protein [Actinacidiphila yeochonensis]